LLHKTPPRPWTRKERQGRLPNSLIDRMQRYGF
jgi:hypothetical protein